MPRTHSTEWFLSAGVAFVFAPALWALAGHWSSVEYYQHGFLVPLVSLFAAWPLLRRPAPGPRWAPGLAFVVGAVALLLLGMLAGSVALQGLALVLALCGLAAFRFGRAGVKRLAFPLAFLLFMVPLPTAWVNPVIVGLQGLATRLAVLGLDVTGVEVIRHGNVLTLPGGGALFVAEACSGITSLLSLIPIGVLLARATQPPGARRWWLVAAVVPAALFANALRVVLTVAVASRIGVERATNGTLHDMAGLLTSVLAVLLVVGVGFAMQWRFDATPPERDVAA